MKRGVPFLKSQAKKDRRIADTLGLLRLGYDAGDATNVNQAYGTLELLLPSRDENGLRYSRVDAAIASRCVSLPRAS